MQISNEARQFVADRQRQGYSHDQIVQELTASGYTQEMINALIGNTPADPVEPKSKKVVIIGVVAVALLLVLGLAALLLTNKDQPQKATTTPPASTNATPKQQDVSAVAEHTKYTTFTQAKFLTFSISKQWTQSPNIKPDSTLFSLFNYDTKIVDAELQATGVKTTSSYADVPKRELKSYPYSIDTMHEIQVLVVEELTEVRGLQEIVKRYQDNATAGATVRDVQYYKINDIAVADLILDRAEGSKDQRIIIAVSPSNTRTIRFIINPTHSRKQVTKDNFDGLMELIGSIKWET